ncbi:response regulator [Shewanella sp. NFH-SH190041]|uniref:response regulator n=1 Tax=Shewanella sp. NFH-SH190041 TaxID=2950245 RepID=UPI0021C2E7FF|nr:response regulator [Shewanella sp. NFH-SH190041]BDM65871.1 response regulator [Shewanella sp. NFH-SH190041]
MDTVTTQVLICDDSALARKQMARALPKEWKTNVTFATNGAEGLEAIRQGKGEVVFLDLNMPVMDGYEVLEQIQQHDLPAMVIVVSSDIQLKAHQKVKALGAIDFIQKPFSPDTVRMLLLEYGLMTPSASAQPVAETPMLKVNLRDACQEIANIAMGRAAELLAKLLDVFVLLPVPNVNVLETSELIMMLKSVEQHQSSALCQGFISAGVAGEALLMFHDGSYDDMAKLMGLSNPKDPDTEIEVLMDTGNVLISAFLNGVFEQLDMDFSQAHPVVLGSQCNIADLLQDKSDSWQRTLAMEINYRIEDYHIQCDLLLLFTEDSIPTLTDKLSYLLD